MVLHILTDLGSRFFPTDYTVHIVVGIASIFAVRAYSQGVATRRERDLHARTVIVTGGFTPFGLTLLQELASRGAHIIALTSDSSLTLSSPRVSLIIDALRLTTSNNEIYAEECDLSSPASIQSFCKRFLSQGSHSQSKGQGQTQGPGAAPGPGLKEPRIDALLLAHEYPHIGSLSFLNLFSTTNKAQDEKERDSKALASFLLTTLLLPAMLVAPPERDIRIVNVVNRFYAAAAGVGARAGTGQGKGEREKGKAEGLMTRFGSILPNPDSESSSPSSSTTPKPAPTPTFLAEGARSLRTIILTRHLQRILDALPSAQAPKTDSGTSAVPVVSSSAQRSNIVAVSVSPGISRADTVERWLGADWTRGSGGGGGYSILGVLIYLLLTPLLLILTKSSVAAVQSVLHVLFLPTPFKLLSQSQAQAQAQYQNQSSSRSQTQNQTQGGSPPWTKAKAKAKVVGGGDDDNAPEEVLRPGSLYAECAVVNLQLASPSPSEPLSSESKGKGKGKENPRSEGLGEGADLPIPNDADTDLGGELLGRKVWEAYEGALKVWEEGNISLEEWEREAVARAEAEAEVEAEEVS